MKSENQNDKNLTTTQNGTNVLMIEVSKIHPFACNPFVIRKDESFAELKNSIASDGIFEPLIVIEDKERGGYEIISGQRRYECAKELNLKTVPVIVKELNRDEAIIAVVDNNIGLRNLLPSEKAFGYKLKLDAMKHQGRKTDIYTAETCGQNVHKSRDDISDEISGRQVQRYIRLTELTPEILRLVDSGRMAMSPAVELSYLSEEVQNTVYETYLDEECTPTVGQLKRMRELSENGKLDDDALDKILSETKANQIERISVPADTIRKLFGNKYTTKDMMQILENALKYYANFARVKQINPAENENRHRNDGAR